MTPPPLPGSSRYARRLRRLFIGLPLLIVAGLVIWHVAWRWSNHRAIRRIETTARARGEPWTLAEISRAYGNVPDEENAAVPLLAIWRDDQPEFWAAYFQAPVGEMPETGKRSQFEPFFKKAPGAIRRGEMTEDEKTRLRTELKERPRRREQVRAALKRPEFRFPVALTNGLSALLPHLSRIKREATEFRLEAWFASEDGNADAALNALESIGDTFRLLEAEPTLVGQLVRVASAHMILSETEHFLTKAAPTRDQLERLDSLLKSLGQKDAFRRAMICERAMGVDLFGSPQLGQQLASLGDAQEREMGWSLVAALTSASGLKDADQRYHLEHLERLLAHSPPDRLARIEAIGETSGEVHAAVRAFPPKILSGMLLPALGTAASKLAETDALRDCALISLAIERHRLAGTGAPPAKLSELALEPPVDPFDGRPLRYVRRDSGYVVYSVGRDRIDNGGKERPRTGNRDSYDVTFTVER